MIDAEFVKNFAWMTPNVVAAKFYARTGESTFTSTPVDLEKARPLPVDYSDAFVREIALESEVRAWQVWRFETFTPSIQDEIRESDGTRWCIRRIERPAGGAWFRFTCVKVKA